MTEQPQDAPDEVEDEAQEPLESATGELDWADEEPDPEMAEPAERVRTGVDRVDEVIRAVEELDDRPLEEHVGVFESAQVQLRRALDDPGDDGQPGGVEHGDDHPGHA
jgi:hypothetical protein